jgi:photosystem II stability/assembly factor-like uncharacterized protein
VGLNNIDIWSLAISRGSIFAGTVFSGVYRSTDNGNTWQKVGLNNSVLSFAVSSDTVFAGTDNGGVYRSTNNGNSWTPIGLSYNNIWSLAISRGSIFAGTGRGIYRSTDNGNTWALLNVNIGEVRSLVVNAGSIFAGGGRDVYQSKDNGNSWSQINKGFIDGGISSLTISKDALFVGTFYSGIYRSTDNGNSWVQVNNGLSNTDIRSLGLSGDNLYAGTFGNGVFRADISGTTTAIRSDPVHSPMKTPRIRFVAPNPTNDITTLEYETTRGGRAEVVLSDVMGKVVATISANAQEAGTHTILVPTTDMAQGIYLLSLRCEGIVATKLLGIVR